MGVLKSLRIREATNQVGASRRSARPPNQENHAMHIDSNFDSGNIEVVELVSVHEADLRIRLDVGGEHMQW